MFGWWLDNVAQTQDGPWPCWDAVMTAQDIHRAWTRGYLQVNQDAQRGKDSVTGKDVLDQRKVERWTDELVDGQAILGQLTINIPKEEGSVRYADDDHRLEIDSAIATCPDSRHRITAIVNAVNTVGRGSGFDRNRRFSVRIYNVYKHEEPRIFYALNQEGQPADATRSKWIYPKERLQALAKTLVERSPHLSADNVDTVRDRLSRRNPRLVAFNTISTGFEDFWKGFEVDLDDSDKFEEVVRYLVDFWDSLVDVLPELRRLPMEQRKRIRETSLMDSAIAIHGYLQLARSMYESRADPSILQQLGRPELFSRDNPEWVRLGVLIPVMDQEGNSRLNLRNARQAREAMGKRLRQEVGLLPSTAEDAVPSLPAVGALAPANAESSAADGETRPDSWQPLVEILRISGQPLPYRELHHRLQEHGGGFATVASFLSALTREANEGGRFVRVGRGKYWLRGEALPPVKAAHAPTPEATRRPISARRLVR
jgi:hypothetical protein